MSGTPVPDAPGDSAGTGGTVGSAGPGDAADLPRAAAYENQRRHVRIETRVLEKTGVRAALSVPGVIVHSSGIGKLTGRRLPRIAVRMDSQGRSATVDAQLAVAWPGPVVAVAQVARETVAEWIEHSTGVPVLAVNVEVAAVVPTDDPASGRVTIQDLREAPRTPALTPVTATPLAVTPVTAPSVRAADRLRHPVAPAHAEVVHPRAIRPPAPVSVTAPPPLPVHHVQPPVPAPVALLSRRLSHVKALINGQLKAGGLITNEEVQVVGSSYRLTDVIHALRDRDGYREEVDRQWRPVREHYPALLRTTVAVGVVGVLVLGVLARVIDDQKALFFGLVSLWLLLTVAVIAGLEYMRQSFARARELSELPTADLQDALTDGTDGTDGRDTAS
jgi:uncharacterized alkaline shock family protein YloU